MQISILNSLLLVKLLALEDSAKKLAYMLLKPTNAGGVGMFIRSLINFEKTEYELQVNGCEEIWVKIITPGCTKVFGILYRYPNNNIKKYSKALEKTLMMLNKQKLTYYICGDKYQSCAE